MTAFHKRLVSFILLIATLFGILSVGGVAVSALSAEVVTTDAVRLRSSASISSDNIITTLNMNETLTLLENSENGWAYVSRKDGTKGYCSVDYLNSADGSGAVIKGVTTDDVNFRKGPSTDYASLDVLNTGTEFVVVDNSDELWVKAKVDDTTGYIYRTYTELTAYMPDGVESTPIPSTPNWFEQSELDKLTGNDSDTNTPLAAEITLSSNSIEIEQGSKHPLAVYITGGESVQGAVSFKSSDTSIATVSSNGTVKGVGIGNAEITATLTGTDCVAVCKVKVTESTTTAPEEPITISETKISVNKGNHYQLKADVPVKWKSSNTNVATVSNGIVTAKATGTAIITAYTDTQSVDCKVTVSAVSSGVSIHKTSAIVTAGKSYYNGATSSASVSWSSSDTDVAKVQNGFITGVSEGVAVITAKNSTGVKTCLVTVKAAEPIRFTFAEPNTAAKNETITLYAVTDKTRTAVKFNVSVGGSIKTVNATNKVSDGNTLVWSGTTTISTSGTYSVVAYSKQSGDWQTCTTTASDAKTTIFIRETADLSTETTETRRASSELITLLSEFEGYSPSVYFDTVASGVPTLGYGKVIYIGDSFYNDMTKKEAYAYLVQTVNNGGFTTAVNNYLDNYSIKRNQYQFDSLMSFVYNLGSNILTGDSDFKKIFLATNIKEEESASDTDAYINASGVNLRSSASTSGDVLAVLDYGAVLTLVEKNPKDGWYHVKTQNGTDGYVYATYVTKGRLSKTNDYSLGRVDKAEFTKLLLQYHHAGATCVSGLLYRRVDELDVFYYGDYVRNGSKNVYGYKFTCAVNSSTTL
ncbi:MAG: SH3 domain-containing protein [Ruminococcus sp.]|nr:SH3 domain-containing protein [Ruminococcus sp.]